MKYEDIIKLEDLEERHNKIIEYYVENVGILDWMTNDNEQIINFIDRVEYKSNNNYHRLDGPAIDYIKGNGEYFINGQKMTKDEWEPISKNILRELKLKRTLKNNDIENDK